MAATVKVVFTVSLRGGHTTFLNSFLDSCKNNIKDLPLPVVHAINKVNAEITTTAIIRTIVLG